MAARKNTVPSPPAPNQPELPVQAQVEEPIINGPYDEPKQHWKYDKQGKAHREPGRRPAEYFWTTQRVMTGQMDLEDIGSGDSGSEQARSREPSARGRGAVAKQNARMDEGVVAL